MKPKTQLTAELEPLFDPIRRYMIENGLLSVEFRIRARGQDLTVWRDMTSPINGNGRRRSESPELANGE